MKDWIRQINDLKIIILGDIMLDRYIKGTSDRNSPEAPVPILVYESTEHKLGGAANVALNLKCLGAQVTLVGVTGDDNEGDELRRLCEQSGISSDHIATDTSRPTTMKTRYMAREKHLLRVDKELTASVSEEIITNMISSIEQMLSDHSIDVLIFQDYDKGVLNQNLIHKIISLCQSKHVLTMVDPKFNNFWYYEGVDLFKPNVNESSQALQISTDAIKSNLLHAAASIQSRLKNRITLITAGEQGLFISDKQHQHFEPGIPIEVADVCGAGDTVISVAACAVGCGLSIQQIGYWCNQAAAWACKHAGVVSINNEQLKDLI